MDASQLATIIAAMFSGFSALIAAAFKGYSLVNKVGKKVDHSDYSIEKKIEDLKKTVIAENARLENQLNIVTAKLVWTEGAPQKTKEVMTKALEEMRKMNESQKHWITEEIVRVRGGNE